MWKHIHMAITVLMCATWHMAMDGCQPLVVSCAQQRLPLALCRERTAAGIADMIARGRLPQLLAVQMTLNDVLQNGCMMPRRKYDDLYKQYLEIAEGMLNA